MSKKAIIVKKLIKRYKKAEDNAVDNISFEVDYGSFFALLGPNGAGKTTTISILTTTLSKTSGEVKIAGYDTETEASKVRQNIGVIFQKPSLDENLTAEENIRFHCALYGIYDYKPSFSLMPQAYKKKIKKMAKILSIANSIHEPIKTFSGGMKRKMEIIRSLMHSPKVLFLDEPTSGLDPASRKSLWKYLKDVKDKEDTTIFLTTHYLEEAEDADKIAIIDNGNIISIGTPTKIKKDIIRSYIQFETSNADKLEKELLNKKIIFDKTNNIFKLPLKKGKAQEIIASLDTKIDRIDIKNPTLEEAYLESIHKYEKGN